MLVLYFFYNNKIEKRKNQKGKTVDHSPSADPSKLRLMLTFPAKAISNTQVSKPPSLTSWPADINFSAKLKSNFVISFHRNEKYRKTTKITGKYYTHFDFQETHYYYF